MKINTNYSISPNRGVDQEIEHLARVTQDEAEQLRLAEHSKSRRVLNALAANRNITDEAVQALFDRDIKGVTGRLERLVYVNKSFIGKLFS